MHKRRRADTRGRDGLIAIRNQLHKRAVTLALPDVVFLEPNVGTFQSTLPAYAKSAAWTPEEIDVVLARHGGTPC